MTSDRKSTRLNSSHVEISYAVFCLKKKKPEGILQNPGVLTHLDWDRPVGLMLCGILHHLLDEEHPTEVMAGLCRSIPAGSYVFIHHLLDCGDPAVADVQAALQQGLGRGQFRTRAQ